MKIVHFPHPSLITRAIEVTDFNDEIKAITQEMLSLMKEHKGVGLAANQVNILKRIVVMNCNPEEESVPYVFINPEIVSNTEEEKEYKEGCLSFPSLYVNVSRPAKTLVKWQDIDGAFQEKEFEGLEAVCIQHEIDHLNGINFIDRLSKTKRQMSLLKYSKTKNKIK